MLALFPGLNITSGELNILYGYDHVQSNYSGSVYSGKFHHAEAYINHHFSNAIDILAGISYETFQLPKPDTINTLISPYASIVLHYKGLHVEVGARYNKHNRYGDNFTYSFNPSYLINDRVKLFVDVSSGFRVPSIGELFGPFGPNPHLKPENSYTQEGGVQVWVLNKKLSFIASYFNRDIKNIITYDYPQGYVNRDRQQDHGIETEINYSPDAKWKLRASYTYIDGKITQKQSLKDTTFYNLIRRPKNTVDLFASLQITNSLLVSTSVQYFGKRIDNYYNPANFYAVEIKTLDAYTLWNLHAEFSLSHNALTVFADAKNLLNNTSYYEVYGFNVQGINITTGVKFKL